MESSVAIQEIIRGTHPTTLSFRRRHARLCIIQQSRQVMDFDKVGQSKERPNANRFYKENGFGTAVVLQFIVGILDFESCEFWNCNFRVKQRKLIIQDDLGDTFSIEVRIKPNGLVCFPAIDIKQNQLPNYLCNVKCILPVEDDPLNYVDIKLYHNNSEGKTSLNYLRYFVATHEMGRDLYDYQEGRSIMEVERPQLKTKMTGILADDIGRQIIKLFQNLGDNGLYEQFNLEQKKLLKGLKELEERFGKEYFKDLELSVKLEESILLFAQRAMEACKKAAQDVIDDIRGRNIPNSNFLMAKAHYIISAVYRQDGDFDKAKEHIEYSTELLESVAVCEETAVNQYNWAALWSEKAAKLTLTSAEQKDAECRFENVLLHWRQQTENDTNRCPMRTQIRNINFYLRTSRKNVPDESKPVDEEALGRAWKAIVHVEQHLLKTCSKRHKVTFYIAKSDYYIRKFQMNGLSYTYEQKIRDALEARAILADATKIATDFGLEQQGIDDRIQNIEKQLFHSTKEENHCHSERARELSRNVAVENEAKSIENLLASLGNVAMELVGREIKLVKNPCGGLALMEKQPP